MKWRVLPLITVYAIAFSPVSVLALAVKQITYANKFNPFKEPKILYSQNSNDAGNFANSQNFTSGTSYFNNQSADDFVVPKGQVWRVTEVDVTGVFFNGSGPATSEHVIFYKNKKGVPGDPVTNGTFNYLNGTNGPNFTFALPGRGLRLRSGHYWMSVVANMDFGAGQGEWGWEVSDVRHRVVALWRNPENGFGTGCTTWQPIENCLAVGPDLMFALKGKIK